MRRLFPLLLVFSLTGCGASMVSTRGDSQSPYAPTNERDSRGGTVKYLNEGIASVRKSRREDAYRQMHDFCNGAYKITAEGPKSEGGMAMPIGNAAYYGDSQYWYMSFECESH